MALHQSKHSHRTTQSQWELGTCCHQTFGEGGFDQTHCAPLGPADLQFVLIFLVWVLVLIENCDASPVNDCLRVELVGFGLYACHKLMYSPTATKTCL